MSLPMAIADKCGSIKKLVLEQGAELHEMRRLAVLLGHAQILKLVVSVQSIQTTLQSEANWLGCYLHAAQAGETDPRHLPATDLELHPAHQASASAEPMTQAEAVALLRGLHRAGDHTQDPEAGERDGD